MAWQMYNNNPWAQAHASGVPPSEKELALMKLYEQRDRRQRNRQKSAPGGILGGLLASGWGHFRDRGMNRQIDELRTAVLQERQQAEEAIQQQQAEEAAKAEANRRATAIKLAAAAERMGMGPELTASFHDADMDALDQIRQQMATHQGQEAIRPPADSRTDDIREFEYSRNNPGFEDFLDRGNRSTVIQETPTGPIPPGYHLIRGEDGETRMEPIPGSPAAKEIENVERANTAKRAIQERTAGIITDDVERIMGLLETASIPETGLAGSLASFVPGTDAHNVDRLIQGIEANVTFDRLQAMREASPGGASGLGQVTTVEIDLLRQSLGSLSQSQTKDQFSHNLKRVRFFANRAVHGLEVANAMEEEYANREAGGQIGQTDQQVFELLRQLQETQ